MTVNNDLIKSNQFMISTAEPLPDSTGKEKLRICIDSNIHISERTKIAACNSFVKLTFIVDWVIHQLSFHYIQRRWVRVDVLDAKDAKVETYLLNINSLCKRTLFRREELLTYSAEELSKKIVKIIQTVNSQKTGEDLPNKPVLPNSSNSLSITSSTSSSSSSLPPEIKRIPSILRKTNSVVNLSEPITTKPIPIRTGSFDNIKIDVALKNERNSTPININGELSRSLSKQSSLSQQNNLISLGSVAEEPEIPLRNSLNRQNSISDQLNINRTENNRSRSATPVAPGDNEYSESENSVSRKKSFSINSHSEYLENNLKAEDSSKQEIKDNEENVVTASLERKIEFRFNEAEYIEYKPLGENKYFQYYPFQANQNFIAYTWSKEDILKGNAAMDEYILDLVNAKSLEMLEEDRVEELELTKQEKANKSTLQNSIKQAEAKKAEAAAIQKEKERQEWDAAWKIRYNAACKAGNSGELIEQLLKEKADHDN